MLTYGIDWDDVISDLNTHAIQLANGEHGLDLKLEDINSWENVGKASVIKQYYHMPGKPLMTVKIKTTLQKCSVTINLIYRQGAINYASNRRNCF